MSVRDGVNVPGLLYLALVLAVVFVPMFLGRGRSSPGPSDSDPEGGSGGGPREPRTPSDGNLDRPPLDDADPTRFRLRDHAPPGNRQPFRNRRPSREPDRTRAGALSDGQ
jgi:hypothetical protein